MKIIKRNKKHLWVECDRCGSILEPTEKDFEECTNKTQDPHNRMRNGPELYIFTKEETVRWIYCPVCGHDIRIDRKIKESYEPI